MSHPVDLSDAAGTAPTVEKEERTQDTSPSVEPPEAAPAPEDDPARTPRIESHLGHGAAGEEQPAALATASDADYFGDIAENRKSSSGFLASLSSSNISSPLQSTYASSASLQSSSEHASGEVSAPPAAEPAFSLSQAIAVAEARRSPAPPAVPGPSTHDFPIYPDQSHAALHAHAASLPHAYLQARNSDYATRHPASLSNDHLSQVSVSVSADHTPLQSPGLFQPRQRPIVRPAPRADKGPSLLHPTHHARVTIETNKLIKDFDSVTGNKIMNDYEVFEKLGVGSHGAVKRARNLRTSEDVAIKIVRRYGKKGRLGRRESPEDKVRKEVAVLKKARHPHVVSLLEVIDDPEAQKVYLVLEFVKRGEIIWRTETSRDVARFEMSRVKRERSANVDEGFESDLAAVFNVKAERARILSRIAREEGRRRRAADRARAWQREAASDPEHKLRQLSVTEHAENLFADFESGQDLGNERHWSNEFGGNESDSDQHHRFEGPSSVIHQLHDGQESGHLHAHDPLLDTEASLIGSQYGPYSADDKPATRSDFDLARRLYYPATDEVWTTEENAHRYVPCMTMTQVRDAFRDTVLGLEYLHYQGIIHRDIKPANLLWTEYYRVKISDFGVSHIGKPIRDTDDELDEPPTSLNEEYELAKTVGTPAFYAPELCDPDWFDSAKARVRPRITGQIDVWALGVSLYAMVYGRLPFFDEVDEFAMYEKIARQEAFLSSYRLRGVDENGSLTNSNKRSPELIEYEPVDGILKDLLRRLLIKDPSRRISLKEVKHHPWLLQGLVDPEAWINETDPSRHSEGKKIEVSNKDVDFALAPLNLVDRIKHGIRRLGSVVRGREPRRRAESGPKETSGSNSSRSTTVERDGRRPSLMGDEQIFSALRAARENWEHHPLSHSVMASPVTEKAEPLFARPLSQVMLPPSSHRPSVTERTESTTDSIRTVRALPNPDMQLPMAPPSISEDPRAAGQPESAASSSSGLSGLIGVASRRLKHTMRSRERGNRSRGHSSASSRSSSNDNLATVALAAADDQHGFPSVALSPAMAAGHVDYSLPTEHAAYPDVPESTSPAVTHARAELRHMQRMAEDYTHRPRNEFAPAPCLGDEDEAWVASNSHSSAEYLGSIGAVSSDDQMALSESYSNPSIPSTSTSTSHPDNASSMLATSETIRAGSPYRKSTVVAGPSATPAAGSAPPSRPPHPDELKAPCQQSRHEVDEAGYHGDGDGNGSDDDYDEDEDDGIIMMSGTRR